MSKLFLLPLQARFMEVFTFEAGRGPPRECSGREGVRASRLSPRYAGAGAASSSAVAAHALGTFVLRDQDTPRRNEVSDGRAREHGACGRSATRRYPREARGYAHARAHACTHGHHQALNMRDASSFNRPKFSFNEPRADNCVSCSPATPLL